MIEYVNGAVAELTPTYVVIETSGGVAYMLNITLQTYTALQNTTTARVLVHETIREDAWVLYGFTDKTERELFRLLLGVSGVGAASARTILSAIPTTELQAVISCGDLNRLKSVKGIGVKTAQRIIVDLRDKINVAHDALLIHSTPNSAIFDESILALEALGYSRASTKKVVERILKDSPDARAEAVIKRALSML